MGPENKPAREQVASRLNELRATYRRTQQECADALGISQSSYAEMESGSTRVRRRDMVTLAVFYGIDLDQAFPPALAEASKEAVA